MNRKSTKEHTSEEVRDYLKEHGYTEIWADLDLVTYGGLFVKEDYPGCFEIVELIDLESAAGVDQTMLIERGSVSYAVLHKNKWSKGMWRGLLGSTDNRPFLEEIAKTDKALARLLLAADIWNYMGSHHEQINVLFVRSDEAYPINEGWNRFEIYDDILEALDAVL